MPRGRPRHGDSTKTIALNLKVTPELRELVEATARYNGRTITAEVEACIATFLHCELPVRLGFKKMLALIYRLYGVDPASTALAARVAQFQRNGVPSGTHVGQGRSAEYTEFRILELVFALDLADCGMALQFIVTLCKWGTVGPSVWRSALCTNVIAEATPSVFSGGGRCAIYRDADLLSDTCIAGAPRGCATISVDLGRRAKQVRRLCLEIMEGAGR